MIYRTTFSFCLRLRQCSPEVRTSHPFVECSPPTNALHEDNRIAFLILHGTAPEYQYHLKDHLGNVRVTFTTREETEETTATVEEENADEELAHYLRYDKIRKVHARYFDHTNDNDPVSTDGYAMRLSGGENERFGLARSISVMPGDKITAEVYAKYVDATSTDPNFTALLANIAGQIAAGNTASGLVVDGGSFSSSTASFPFPVENGATKTSNPNTGTGPKAYLNWLVFDRDYNFILSKSGFYPLSATPKEDGTDIAHERLYSPEITIDQAGYVYIYLSNEEDQLLEVYFDDFRVEHVKSSVVQMDDYYPFGLTYNSYKRENSVENRIKFQGQEHIDDLNLGWDSFKWRNHMPDIGRFFNVDPLSEKYYYNSPYAFSENHVTSHVELEGLEKVDFNKKDVDRMQNYFQNNAQQGSRRDDCITCHNKGMRLLLNNNSVPVGSQADITRTRMQNAGYAGPTQTIGFKQDDGSKAVTPGQVASMDGSVANTASNLSEGTSNSVFGVSILDGYHTMTLTVSTSEVEVTQEMADQMGVSLQTLAVSTISVTTFTLSDQGSRDGTNFQGNLTFTSAEDLDAHLTKYVRDESQLDFPAMIQIHQIQQPEDEN